MSKLTNKDWLELEDAKDYFEGFRMEELKSDDVFYLKILFKHLPIKETEVTERDATEQEENVFAYLNGLREEGTINMFASPPLVANVFNIPTYLARSLFNLWTINFNNECNYKRIKLKKDD